MDYSLLSPIIRHILQAIGGGLVTSGYLDESMTETFVGLGLNAGALIWWAVERGLKARREPDPMDGIQ